MLFRYLPMDHGPSSQNHLSLSSSRHRPRLFAAIFSLSLLIADAALAVDTYRWVDDQGVMHYTDKLQPEDVKRPRAKLNSDAKIVQSIEGEKTPEQLEQLKRLRQLRVEQMRILNEQRESDHSLMMTYRSEDEIRLALKGKLNALDSAKRIAETNRQTQEDMLRSQVKRAAEIESQGQPLPQNLKENIESTRRQISGFQEKIRSLEVSKTETVAAFAKDLVRYQSLEALNKSGAGYLEWHPQSQQADVGVLSAVACQPHQCQAAWAKAAEYVQARTGKPALVQTETLLQTASVRFEKDIAILVVRIPGKTSDIIFLDTSCHFSSIGEELCLSDSVRNIRAGFVPYLQHSLK